MIRSQKVVAFVSEFGLNLHALFSHHLDDGGCSLASRSMEFEHGRVSIDHVVEPLLRLGPSVQIQVDITRRVKLTACRKVCD